MIFGTKEAGCFKEVTAVTITNTHCTTVGSGMAHQTLPVVWRSAPVWEVVDKHCIHQQVEAGDKAEGESRKSLDGV